jgi:O-acetyl-ADP-ribose deacetylase
MTPADQWFDVVVGDVLDQEVDVIICSGNVQLNLSGGVGGALLLRGGVAVQVELHEQVRRTGRKYVDPGTIAVTGPGELPVMKIVHVVAMDAFYQTSKELISSSIQAALTVAHDLGARSIAMSAIATGYGRFPMTSFGSVLVGVLPEFRNSFSSIRLIVTSNESAEIMRAAWSTIGLRQKIS